MVVFAYEHRESSRPKRCLRFVRKFAITPIEVLKPHEDVDPHRLSSLTREIGSDGVLKRPIVADHRTNVVLDGHHRLQALKLLGCRLIPVIYVDYRDSRIIVKTYRESIELTKDIIVEAGLKGHLFPPKTSKHMVLKGSDLTHISEFEKPVHIPLSRLRKPIR
ncbi:hypothetical protein DRO57_01745 [Candidatus Bathyarchaeota archaeon]|nr:MAG: hypothetical protein DRO57_01745 [Candidatus Bathyarchaeota archaeon]